MKTTPSGEYGMLEDSAGAGNREQDRAYGLEHAGTMAEDRKESVAGRNLDHVEVRSVQVAQLIFGAVVLERLVGVDAVADRSVGSSEDEVAPGGQPLGDADEEGSPPFHGHVFQDLGRHDQVKEKVGHRNQELNSVACGLAFSSMA